LDTTIAPPRVAGVVYTKPWMMEMVLDLAGYGASTAKKMAFEKYLPKIIKNSPTCVAART
jgi:hypothetical protein